MPTTNITSGGTGRAGFEELQTELSAVTSLIEKNSKQLDDQYRSMKNELCTVRDADAELRAKMEEQSTRYAELLEENQACQNTLKEIKRFMDSPVYRGKSDLADHDKQVAITLQKRAFVERGGSPAEFTPDYNNLVNITDYRSAVRKLMRVGLETKAYVLNSLTDAEKRAFDAGSLGTAFFSPEILGFTVDCDPECGSMLDLYSTDTATRSIFQYPNIKDYGAIGSYECGSKCDAPLGPEGNITFNTGKTYSFRGVFCFNKEVLSEANYDLLSFMIRAAARSHRVNRGRVAMLGNGLTEPLGWASGAGLFPVRSTAEKGKVTAADIRLTLNGVLREYGNVIAVMHQNVFAMISTMLDAQGNFIFGKGDLLFAPEKVSDYIRVSNCLPDATEGLARGNDNLVAGSFLMAVANWKSAYHLIDRKPLFFQQWEAQSSAWCVSYQFSAEDGGVVGCPQAGLILRVQ